MTDKRLNLYRRKNAIDFLSGVQVPSNMYFFLKIFYCTHAAKCIYPIPCNNIQEILSCFSQKFKLFAAFFSRNRTSRFLRSKVFIQMELATYNAIGLCT